MADSAKWGLGALVVLIGAAGLGIVVSDEYRPLSASSSSDAIATAWARVNDAPEDPAAWAALGDVHAAHDASEAAEQAYRRAIALGGTDGSAFARLGFLLYARGEDGEAQSLLLEAKRRGAEVPMLDFTLGRLRRRDRDPTGRDWTAADRAAGPPRPPPASSTGSTVRLDAGVSGIDASFVSEPLPPVACSVPIRRRGRSVFLVDLSIRGTDATMIVDTGASLSLVTEELAVAAGLSIDETRRMRGITASGPADYPTTVLEEVALAGRVTGGLRVAVCETCIEDIGDGLFGLDLIEAFGLALDLDGRRLVFTACE